MILLGLLSLGLVATWVYHFYEKWQLVKGSRTETAVDMTRIELAIRDSIQQLYAGSLSELDKKLDSTRVSSDSVHGALQLRLVEVHSLRNEIDQILQNRNSTSSDLRTAWQKINELRTLISSLQGEKSEMEAEKKRLNDVLAQLSGDIAGLQRNLNTLSEENRKLQDKVQQASLFVASEIQLKPVTVRNSREQETSLARKASKFVISFTVQNNTTGFPNADVYVVITQPDGNVLKNDEIWGATVSRDVEGAPLSYTREVRFDYNKGESKKLLFSVNADRYMKGAYRMQLYHQGIAIGETKQVLN